MANEKVADYKPTDDEIRDALRGLLRLVRKNDLLFKIGRCADDGKNGLEHRDMYEDAEKAPKVIWSGSPHKAAWLEKALIRIAWRNFPTRCCNKQEGGGDLGQHPTHHIYVVRWKPTLERLLDIYCALIEREAATEQ